MDSLQPKKLLIINILDILQKYSDAEHTLTQADISKRLEKDYSMHVDRKSIKRNLMNLVESGYDIAYTESTKINKNGEEEIVATDWYLRRKFEDSELRLLVDILISSKSIAYKYRQDLIRKIEGLSNSYFHKRVKHIIDMPEFMPANKELFLTIDELDYAIENKKKVSFRYCSYGLDKKLHPRRDNSGAIRDYVINPYQLAVANGRYYLICNYDKYDGLSNYRVDRIKSIKVIDETAKALDNSLDLKKYMEEHIYMFAGESAHVSFLASRSIINDIVDCFGTKARLTDAGNDMLLVNVSVNEDDMYKWAMQYADKVEVLEPVALRNRIIETLKGCLERYSQKADDL